MSRHELIRKLDYIQYKLDRGEELTSAERRTWAYAETYGGCSSCAAVRSD